jgi:hypothetical protein
MRSNSNRFSLETGSYDFKTSSSSTGSRIVNKALDFVKSQTSSWLSSKTQSKETIPNEKDGDCERFELAGLSWELKNTFLEVDKNE